ncbi:hypothetical protein LTSESEN_3091 [Salmonella enterica subsp. enterica serovar Senftenberg str. A4-543]|uniref:Uncharacterized protein n=1 Tax=Salmonella enterica subsp. enterica serovar Senftenberg str. A4-543 TaxID=913082 RepID=G5R1B4_SALSE|nr:hypothetical protein LTSESEN_3091 [Salmonella enterica subsp. enterica serovar Senftenberg str. A4-543]
MEMHTKYQFLKGLFAMGSRGALQDAQSRRPAGPAGRPAELA